MWGVTHLPAPGLNSPVLMSRRPSSVSCVLSRLLSASCVSGPGYGTQYVRQTHTTQSDAGAQAASSTPRGEGNAARVLVCRARERDDHT